MRNDEYIKAVKRNSNRLYLIAFSYLQNHHDAEDVMQDALLKLWKTNKVFCDDEQMVNCHLCSQMQRPF